MSSTEHEVLTEQIKGLTTLINAQFTNVDDHFNNINQRLDKINGKVGRHEEQIQEALIERAKNREQQRNMIPEHISTCPNLQEIRACRTKFERVEEKMEGLEKQLEDAFFFIRHPKLFIGVLSVIVILTIASFVQNNKWMQSFMHAHPQTTQTEQLK